MTRKEQIEQAAKLRYGNQGASFIHGAQWADTTFAEYVRKRLLDHINDIRGYLSTDRPHGRERADLCSECEIYENIYMMIGEIANLKQ